MLPLIITTLALAFASNPVRADGHECPAGMKQRGDFCYRKTGHATRDAAFAQCDQPGEYVLDGSDIAEFNAVVELLRVINTGPGGVGGGRGPYFWVNPPQSSGCLTISGRGSPTGYTPMDCGEFFQAICKFDLDVCPSPWVDKRGEGLGCYQVPNLRVSHASARNYCRSRGTELVEISSKAENQAVADIIVAKADSYTSNANYAAYIGLYDVSNNDKFYWDNSGANADRGGPSFTCWGSTEPQPERNERCVAMSRSVSASDCNVGRGWSDITCNRSEYFVCEGIPTSP